VGNYDRLFSVVLKGATLLHDDFRFPKGLALLGENHSKERNIHLLW